MGSRLAWLDLEPYFRILLADRDDPRGEASPATLAELLSWIERLAVAERAPALALVEETVARWSDQERQISAAEVDPRYFYLARSLTIDTRVRPAHELERRLACDLTQLEGVVLRHPTRALVETLARHASSTRWRTLSIELPRGAAGVIDTLFGLPLDRLKYLQLIGAGVGNRVLERLTVTSLPSLRELSLHQTRADHVGVTRLGQASWARCITTLELTFTRADARLTAALAQGFATHVELLDLVFDDIGPAALATLLARVWPALRELDLVGNRLGRKGAAIVAGATDSLPRLTRLDLGNTGLTPAGMTAIARSPWMQRLDALGLGGGGERMKAAPTLAILRHSGAGKPLLNDGDLEDYIDFLYTPARLCRMLTAPGFAGVRRISLTELASAKLAAALAESPYVSGLRELYLGHFALDADTLARALANPALRGLEELDLYGTPLARAGVRAIAASGLRLRSLHLDGTDIGDAGIELLAEAGVLASLECLQVRKTGLGTAGLARLLDAAPNLHQLDIAQNSIGPSAGMLLGRARQEWRFLNLCTIQLGDDGLRALLASARLDKLRSLQLATDRLTDAGGTALLDFFARRPPCHLHLERNKLTPEMVERLRALAQQPGWYATQIMVQQNRGSRALAPAPPTVLFADEDVTLSAGEWALAGRFALGRQRALVTRLRAQGARAQNSLRSSTTRLAVGAAPGPRLAQAVARGLPLVSEDALYRALGLGSLEAVLEKHIAEAAARLPAVRAWSELVDSLDRWQEVSLAPPLPELPPAPPVTRAGFEDWCWRWSGHREAPRHWLNHATHRPGGEPRLQLCRGIRLDRSFAPARLRRLLVRPELGSIEWLDLRHVRTGEGPLTGAWLGAPIVDALTHLWLPQASTDLARTHLPRLRVLGLNGQASAEDLAALARASFWPQLDEVSWMGGLIGDDGLARLVERLDPGRLRLLELNGQELGPRAVATLGQHAWPVLDALALGAARLDRHALDTISALPALRHLHLDGERHEARRTDLYAWLASAPLATIEHLSLPHAPLVPAFFKALLASSLVRPGARLTLGSAVPAELVARIGELEERGVVVEAPLG